MKDFLCNNKNKLWYLLGLILIILAWVISSNEVNNAIILPKPKDVVLSLFHIVTKFENIIIIINTLSRLITAVAIGFALGLIVMILYLIYPPILQLFKPLITISKSTPVASIIIICLIWVGSKYSPILITALVIFPVILEAMIAGVKSIDKSYLEELQLNGGMNPYSIRKVLFPFTYPYLFLGIIQSVGLGLKVMVMAELISQTQTSIGNELYINKVYFQMANLFAWTIILIILVTMIEHLIGKAKKRLI
ncbi:MAG TPA: hypothetical protein PLR26_04205 [Bacilli bacterium]|nr:hypothetical protein [Bacilli bacterium]